MQVTNQQSLSLAVNQIKSTVGVSFQFSDPTRVAIAEIVQSACIQIAALEGLDPTSALSLRSAADLVSRDFQRQ